MPTRWSATTCSLEGLRIGALMQDGGGLGVLSAHDGLEMAVAGNDDRDCAGGGEIGHTHYALQKHVAFG